MQALKQLKYRLFPSRAHMLFQWHVTSRCNLGCIHCYQNRQTDELDWPSLEHVLDQIKSFLSFQEKNLRKPIYGQINLTGGEPFVRKDFIPLVEKISGVGRRLRFAILTNGSLIDKDLARILSKLNPAFVQVSLEGSKSIHDRIRGVNSFDKTINGLEHLIAAKIKTLVSFTAHKINYNYFGEVVKTGCELGVNRIWADRLIPLGKGENLNVLSPSESQKFFKDMYQAKNWARNKGYHTQIPMQRALQFLISGEIPYQCKAGNSLLTIMPDGELMPCRRMPVFLGNVCDTSIANIFYSSPFLNQLRSIEEVPKGCEQCKFMDTCRGGLRCLAFAKYKDPFAADPGCWMSMT